MSETVLTDKTELLGQEAHALITQHLQTTVRISKLTDEAEANACIDAQGLIVTKLKEIYEELHKADTGFTGLSTFLAVDALICARSFLLEASVGGNVVGVLEGVTQALVDSLAAHFLRDQVSPEVTH